MSTLKDKKVAIVGGGPGGLTLARLLQLSGADAAVYERDRDSGARAQGATLDLHDESGLKALQQAELMEAFQANYRPGAEKLRVMDKHARILLDEHGSADGKISRPEIDRGPLQKILLDSLRPDTVVWNSHLVSLAPQNGFWRLESKDGSSALADVVIAADGANSKVRPYLTPIKPFYSGVTVVEGAVHDSETASPKMHRLLKGGKIFAFGDEKSLIVSSKGDGSLVFYTGVKTEEQWSRAGGIDFGDGAQVLSWFQEEYSGWDGVWRELFESASLPFVPRPQYYMPLDQTWEALPNLTVLGDAAHLMPPFTGEGVNMAMLDALELSECLTGEGFSDTHSAIAAYEKRMRVRAAEIGAITLESTAALHSPEAIPYLLEAIGG